ncbi:MAG: D-glycero-beta-D-manno-heptose 1,7-bisphosphate 7-phosphatase [Chloroflexi bacterium]|nr:D-glycero-beta-D-manno-heptose 1,7-bisphosphate 7-phosphatase [Chloroflexota bacterium]
MRAVFLDRDGVINVSPGEHKYVESAEEFVFLPGVKRALRRLAKTPYAIIIVTNQSVVGKGLISLAQLEEIHYKMLEELNQAGGRIDKVYVCPHRPEENCACRKPKGGMLQTAAAEFGVNLKESFLIGDSLDDAQAGYEAGCRVILVLSGRYRGEATTSKKYGSFQLATDLSAAVEIIIARREGDSGA